MAMLGGLSEEGGRSPLKLARKEPREKVAGPDPGMLGFRPSYSNMWS